MGTPTSLMFQHVTNNTVALIHHTGWLKSITPISFRSQSYRYCLEIDPDLWRACSMNPWRLVAGWVFLLVLLDFARYFVFLWGIFGS